MQLYILSGLYHPHPHPPLPPPYIEHFKVRWAMKWYNEYPYLPFLSSITTKPFVSSWFIIYYNFIRGWLFSMINHTYERAYIDVLKNYILIKCPWVGVLGTQPLELSKQEKTIDMPCCKKFISCTIFYLLLTRCPKYDYVLLILTLLLYHGPYNPIEPPLSREYFRQTPQVPALIPIKAQTPCDMIR